MSWLTRQRSSLKRQRRFVQPFFSSATLRLFFATLDPRRRHRLKAIFNRPAALGSRGFGWVPRLWLVRQGCIFWRSRHETFRVYRGRRARRLFVQRWNIGLKWGDFARTQTLAVFKKRASLKKRRRSGGVPGSQLLDFRVQRMRDLRAGLRRRTSVHYDKAVELQLKGVAL